MATIEQKSWTDKARDCESADDAFELCLELVRFQKLKAHKSVVMANLRSVYKQIEAARALASVQSELEEVRGNR